MARNIKKIAKRLGAKVTGQVPETGGGMFGATRVAQSAGASSQAGGTRQGLMDVFRNAPEELDRIVEDAMRDRRMQAWRPSPENFAALESMAENTGRTLNELLDEAVRLLLERGQKPASTKRGPSLGNV